MSEDTEAGACRFCGTTTNRRDCKGLNCCKDRQYAEAPQSTDGGAGDVRGWKLAMRILQSDLYGQLDDAERAECDALVRANPYIAAASQPAAQAACEGYAGAHRLCHTWVGGKCKYCGVKYEAAPSTAAHAGATWKLVPVEPTETMVTAANEVEYCEDGITRGQLRAAINAAPTPSAAAAQGAELAEVIACIEACVADPMWDAHCEISKASLNRWHKLLLAAAKPVSVDAGGMTDDQLADIQRAAVIIRENSYPCPDKPHSNWALAERIEKIVAPLRKTPPTESTGEPQ